MSFTADRLSSVVSPPVFLSVQFSYFHLFHLHVAHLKNLTGQWPRMPSKSQIFQLFTGNGDVSIWVKILQWDEKNPNKQTNKQTNKQKDTFLVWAMRTIGLLFTVWRGHHSRWREGTLYILCSALSRVWGTFIAGHQLGIRALVIKDPWHSHQVLYSSVNWRILRFHCLQRDYPERERERERERVREREIPSLYGDR